MPTDFHARHTLEMEHRARMAALKAERERQAAKQADVAALKDTIDLQADIYSRMAARRAELERRAELKRKEKDRDEMSYVINAGPVLMRYYDMQRDNEDAAVSRPSASLVKDSILKYFLPDTGNTQTDCGKAQLLKEYERATLGEAVATPASVPPEAEVCKCCGTAGSIVVVNSEAITLCTHCDACEPIVIETERPPSKDTVKDSTAFCYKRLNHFNEWLSQIQGKQQTNIPEDVYANILIELKKRKIQNLSEVTAHQIKDILKKLRYNKWYEHVTFILNRLNGGTAIKPLHPALEETLRSMFRQIQGPFIRHCPPGRKNFLSYSYVLHKLVELLGEDEYLESFPLLKSRDKLAAMDEIFRRCVEDPCLRWQFIPSI